MEKLDGIRRGIDTTGEDERIWLNVAEMIGLLSAIEQNMIDDQCLMDLLPEITAVRDELLERRKIAVQVAAEIDAANCSLPN